MKPRVVQSFEMQRSSQGWIPVAHLTTTTDSVPDDGFTEQATNWFGAEQVL